MKNSIFTKFAIGAAAFITLFGCASQGTQQATDLYSNSERAIAKAVAESRDKNFDAENSGASAHIHKNYFGSKSIPLVSNPVLPEQFHMLKGFAFPGEQFDINQAAQKITAVSGIQVRIGRDILEEGAGKQSVIYMNSTATTAGMLDQITSVDGFSWEYKDGIVYIQKYITREYTVKAPFGSRKHVYKSGSTGNTNAQSSQSGSGGGQISNGFTSETDISSTSDTDPAASVLKAVQSVLTVKGKAVPTGTNGIIVTDAVEGQRRAADIIERENEKLTRSVTYRVQVFSLIQDTADEANLDINALINDVTKFGLQVASPTSIASQNGGTVTYTAISGGTPGRYDGSKAVFQLLATRGRTTSLYDVNVPTRNFISTPLNLTTTTPFLAGTTPAPAGGTGAAGGTPGLTLGNAVTGFKMDFTSTILDSNNISLQFACGLVDLLEIRTVSAGPNLGSLEAPVTSGFELAPELFLKPFETQLITGYERTTNKYNRAGLGQDWPLILGGGSNTSSGKKEKLFILITPTIVTNVI